jgi:hypothetical protein
MRFGYQEAQFFGFRVNAEGSHLALKHLDPIRQMVPPSDIHQLRRVLGLFVVSRKYVKDFATVTKHMTDVLRGKLPTFWGDEQQKAFDFIKDKLLAGLHLAAPDFNLPFHLATDASEDGKGGELYQLPTIPIPDHSKYRLYTYSDHMPLNWMHKTEKGPIRSFIIERLAEIETVHQYIQGKLNTLPDGCS